MKRWATVNRPWRDYAACLLLWKKRKPGECQSALCSLAGIEHTSPRHPANRWAAPDARADPMFLQSRDLARRQDIPQSSALRTPHSVLSTQSSVLSPPHSVLSTQHSALSPQHSVLSTQSSVLSTQHSVLSTQSSVLSPPQAPQRAGHIDNGHIELLFRKGISRIVCLRDQAHRAHRSTQWPDRAGKGVSYDKASLEGVAAFSVPRVGGAGLRRVRLLGLAGAGHRPQ